MRKEDDLHFFTKVKVGRIVDTFFTVKTDLAVKTWYEYPFDKIITERGPRTFIGDVVVFFFDKSKNVITTMDFEVDGVEGHSSQIEKGKNKFRDYCLEEYFKCPVLRIPSIERNRNWIETQLEKFFFTKVIPTD